MPGIYIHIPFCRQACSYCDFHFSVSMKDANEMTDAIVREMEIRSLTPNPSPLERGAEIVKSIYFGGGTPTLLSENELNKIFRKIFELFKVEEDAEITLEANPDDLSEDKLSELRQTPVNRLSIGVQSFHNDDLKFMNRLHNAYMAKSSVEAAFAKGFENISIDLIYGSPTTSNEMWNKNLETAFSLPVNHLSCYSLTVEPKTVLAHNIRKGKVAMPDEQKQAEQFEMLMDDAAKNNFIHYEISNFCKEGFHSKHNSSYWKDEHYIGIGPSAHSYNGISRQWNVASNSAYINTIKKRKPFFESEMLDVSKKYNEYVMTSLRTMWGCSIDHIRKVFGDQLAEYFLTGIKRFIEAEEVTEKNGTFVLTRKGKLFADRIASELFLTHRL